MWVEDADTIRMYYEIDEQLNWRLQILTVILLSMCIDIHLSVCCLFWFAFDILGVRI